MKRIHHWLAAMSLLVLLCAVTTPANKEQQRQWQTGTLVDMNRADAGTRSITRRLYVVLVAWTYLIDAGEYLYESQEIRKSKDSTPLLTVNGPVQFAIEKDHVYIKDEEGKEHDTKLIKKTLKVPGGK